MAILNKLLRLEQQFIKLKESLYTYDDIRGQEVIIMINEPPVSAAQLEEIAENIMEINDELDSKLLSNILEYVDVDSSFAQYAAFDSESFQMDFIQEQIDAYEEKLSEYQEEAARRAHEEADGLWREASDDVVFLMENLLPKLFEL